MIQAYSSMIFRNSQFKLHSTSFKQSQICPQFSLGSTPSEASATPAAAGAAVWQRHLGRLHLRHAEELAQGPGASDPAEAPITWSERLRGGEICFIWSLGSENLWRDFLIAAGFQVCIYNYIYIYLKDLSKRFWGWFGPEDFIGPSRYRHFISPHWWSLLVEIT